MATVKKPVTLRDIAKKAGVSTYSVSVTLKGKAEGNVSRQTQAKIRKAIESLDYKPNYLARGLASGHTMRINIVIMEDVEMTFGHISDSEAYVAAIDYLAGRGYSFNLTRFPILKSTRQYIKIVNDNVADGTIFLRIPEEVLKGKILRNKKMLKKPFVIIGSDLDPDVPHSFFDWKKALIISGKYLANAGHKSLVVFWMESVYKSRNTRLAAIKKGLQSTPAQSKKIKIKEIGVAKRGAATAGMHHIQKLFRSSDRPTAILCTDNILLPGLLLGLEAIQIKVPGDVEVLSIGDASLANLVTPKPSFIDLMGTRQAIEACQILLAYCTGAQIKTSRFSVPIDIAHNQTTAPRGAVN